MKNALCWQGGEAPDLKKKEKRRRVETRRRLVLREKKGAYAPSPSVASTCSP